MALHNNCNIINNAALFSTKKATAGSTWTVTATLLLVIIGLLLSLADTADGTLVTRCRVVGARPLTRRAYRHLHCQGVYNRTTFGTLSNMCETCYSYFLSPVMDAQCRSECFSSAAFHSCVTAGQGDLQSYSAMVLSFSGRPLQLPRSMTEA